MPPLIVPNWARSPGNVEYNQSDQREDVMNFAKSAFKERERGLENEFFHRMDQELIRRLKEKASTEKGRADLVEVTGISDATLLNELLDLGIRSECLVALSLVPLVQVAWSDGGVSSQEREAILQAAADKGLNDTTESYHLLVSWLDHKPEEKLFSAWRHYIAAIAAQLNPQQLQKLKTDVVHRTRTVAEAAGGILSIGAISKNEQAALNDIEQAFSAQE